MRFPRLTRKRLMWGGLFFVIVFGIWLAPDSRYGRKEGVPWPVTSYTPYGKNNPGDWKSSPYGGGRRLPPSRGFDKGGCGCHT